MPSGLAMHCHHDILFEWVWDFDERVADIKANKPEEEQELRLRLFKMVPAKLMPGYGSGLLAAVDKALAVVDKALAALDRAWAASDKAGVAYDKARVAYETARAAYYKAGAAYDKAGTALDRAWAAFNEARAAYDKVWAAYSEKYAKELDTLHEKLCPNCPWDGETIFPSPPN